MIRTQTRLERLSNRIFKAVHGQNLVYNTCWEDPALDRVALKLTPRDRLVVITSAGCNALDYLLAGCGRVNAVDMNPRQNALLELKAAGIRGLDHAAFWEMFGQGQSSRAKQIYQEGMRSHLSPRAQKYWDKHLSSFFNGKGWRNSFYFRGTSGFFAKVMLDRARIFQRLREPLEQLLAAQTVEEQREIYHSKIRDKFWTPGVKWVLARHLTLSLIGVPHPQRQELLGHYGGIAGFIRSCLEAVLCELPLKDNYFWRVYMQGHYTPESCPEYLKPANFERLKDGLIDNLTIHTTSVTEYLQHTEPGVTRFVLLDHMDWMSWYYPQALVDEWNAILRQAAPAARVIFRSASLAPTYLDHLKVKHKRKEAQLGDLLTYDRELAAELHPKDRVHTYGSFAICDLPS
jgi:S-adenosylmethionine-diacylglycerol 3-amino-3-carboxypropyl transferase